MDNSAKYWVACSGGVDSVVLLHLMHEQKKDVGILHCNFHLRGESSNGDEAFVRALAKKLNIPVRVNEFETKKFSKENKMNTQLAARQLRYNWFDEVIENEGGTVLLAHHYDDQVETFFLQLRRGGKVRSLAGMPVFRNGYLRPLLKHTKNDLISLANKQGWKWREDISNASNNYTRNWYRNEILPWLKSNNFPIQDVVSIVESYQQVLKFLKGFPVPDSILIADWNELTIWEKEYILSEQDLGEYSTSEIKKLTISEKGKFIGNDFTKLWNEGKELIFVKRREEETQFQLEIQELSKEDVELNQNDLLIDASLIKGRLTFRKWQSGDRFQPLGMKGEKSVGKFLRDRKVLAHVKEDIQVLVCEKGNIIGIFGFGVSEKFKVDSTTVQIISVQLKKI
ncbi:tRNA lysidine(34) synthetase TilS [Brumimicrobium mesophilum]|uniref:tRNA lysidine(34) synthetase TilS n=1 Tax=Brumimicrobium mesophilum TaxID=392717 RepID=UPI000D1432F5|nr:tRNA lysidine(34) synthetase TilS [Brumimicrobium mesophilum]